MTQPVWITQEITRADCAAINEGGCASGAYMPAVTYHDAEKTMAAHGDDVLDFIEASIGYVPNDCPDHYDNWSGRACYYLAMAVELYCLQCAGEADWDDDDTLIGQGYCSHD